MDWDFFWEWAGLSGPLLAVWGVCFHSDWCCDTSEQSRKRNWWKDEYHAASICWNSRSSYDNDKKLTRKKPFSSNYFLSWHNVDCVCPYTGCMGGQPSHLFTYSLTLIMVSALTLNFKLSQQDFTGQIKKWS